MGYVVGLGECITDWRNLGAKKLGQVCRLNDAISERAGYFEK